MPKGRWRESKKWLALQMPLFAQRLWARMNPDQYLHEVLKANFEMNKMVRNSSLPAPETISELAKLIVLAEHPQAGPRLKSMVEKLQKVYLDD